MEQAVKRVLLGLVAALATGTSFGATVNITSTGNFAARNPYPLCTTAPASLCADFLPTHNVSGTFTTSGPLPTSASDVEIGPTVTAFSFSSGLDVVASSNPDARLNSLRISTDASGNITSVNMMQAVVWMDGTAPHTTANRFSFVMILGNSGAATHNSGCQSIGTGNSGVTDTCLNSSVGDTSRSMANSAPISVAMASAPTSAVPIPTLSQWGTMIMASLLGLFAFARLRRQR